ncbi:hypothetical protein [Cellulomonas sp. P5_C6]
MTSPRPRTLRAAALVVGATVAGLALAGCSATNGITTEDPYSAADGIRFTLGDVRGSNLLVVSAAKGEPGTVLGGLINDGDKDRTVTVSDGTDSTDVELGPKETVLLGGGDVPEDGTATVLFASMDVPPGAVLKVTFSTPEDGSITVDLPVLDGSLPEYATMVPTPSPSS